MRILIGGVEGAPATAPDSSFDEAAPSATSFPAESHAIERSRAGFGGLPAGTYEVKAQFKVGNAGTTLSLFAWYLNAERSQLG